MSSEPQGAVTQSPHGKGGRGVFPNFWLVVLFLTGSLLVVWYFPPESSSFYPACQFFSWTGLQCPACGSLRAGHLWMTGFWKEAFWSNPMLFISVPWLGMIGWWSRSGRFRARGRNPWLWSWLGAVLLFWVVRNL